jgi:peptide/nickel transport system ATP-binding protein
MTLRLDGVSVCYGRHEVLASVSASVRPGDWVVCTGASGSGKSTLAHAIAGTLSSSARLSGAVRLERTPVAAIWQEPSSTFSPLRRVLDQVGDVLAARGAPRAQARDLLSRTGVDGKQDAYPHQFSAGQLQRAALARALAVRPAMLVADEPTSSLDPTTEAGIIELVDDVRREYGFDVLWMTHRPRPLRPWATRWWQIHDGVLNAAAPDPTREAEDNAGPTPARDSAPLVLGAAAIWKSYKEPVLRGADLQLYAGRTTALVGESGAGKSTLGRILAGLESPDAGELKRFGPVQLVMPDPATALNPRWSAAEAVAEPETIRGIPRRQRRQTALRWLERLQLPAAAADRPVTGLSGGQRRRLLIARALVAGPRALIFDEATNGLDPALRDETTRLIRELQREFSLAILWITHDHETLPGFADEVFTLAAGRIRQVSHAPPLHP